MAKLRSTSCAAVPLVLAQLDVYRFRYAPPVQPFHSAATYQPLIDKARCPRRRLFCAPSSFACACSPASPAVQAELSKAFQLYKDDFDTANVM